MVPWFGQQSSTRQHSASSINAPHILMVSIISDLPATQSASRGRPSRRSTTPNSRSFRPRRMQRNSKPSRRLMPRCPIVTPAPLRWSSQNSPAGAPRWPPSRSQARAPPPLTSLRLRRPPNSPASRWSTLPRSGHNARPSQPHCLPGTEPNAGHCVNASGG